MRVIQALVIAAFAIGGCTTLPPASLPATPQASPTTVPPLGTISPTAELTNEPTVVPFLFTFDVENHSSRGVVVSVASDYGASLPGFAPGQRGTISIHLLNPQNGIGVEIQDGACGLLAKALYPTPDPFTLIVADGAKVGEIALSTRKGASATPIPLPSNDLEPCLG